MNKICDLVGKFHEKEILNNRLLTQSQKDEDLQVIHNQRNDIVSKFSKCDKVFT